MARIKFTQEDVSGFGRKLPYQSQTTTRGPTPLEQIATIRQGVALATETAGAVSDAADFITKTAGREPTKEELIQEAAKKRASEIEGKRAAERGAVVSQQEEERKKREMLMSGASRPEQVGEITGRTAVLKNLEQKTRQLYKGDIKIEDYDLAVNEAENAGVITGDVSQRLLEKAREIQAEMRKAGSAKLAAEMKAYQEGEGRAIAEREGIPAGKDPAQVGKVAEQDLADLKAIRQNAIELGQDVADLDASIAEKERQVKAAERFISRGAIVSQEEQAAADRAAVARGQELAAKAAPIEVAGVEQVVETIDQAKAEDLYARIIAKPQIERTRQEEALLQAILKKFPSVEAAGREGEAYGLSVYERNQRAYLQNLQKRKDEIIKGQDTSKAEVQAEIANLDKQIEETKKVLATQEEEARKGGPLGRVAQVASSLVLKTQDPATSLAELEKKKAALTEQLTQIDKTAQEQLANEDTRQSVVKSALTGVLSAVAELQGLNEKRATQGLTEDEANRFIQLENYVRQTQQITKQASGLKQDAEFGKTISEFQTAINEGNLPQPESSQQIEARFQDSLKVFDEATAAEIKAAADEEAAKIGKEFIDADQLKVLAAYAALTGDQKVAAKILAHLSTGKVSGIQPNSFSEWFSGKHKSNYNDEVFKILFSKTGGKSPQELALAYNKFMMKNLFDLGLLQQRATGARKTEQDIDIAEEQRIPKLEKLEAETSVAKQKALLSDEILSDPKKTAKFIQQGLLSLEAQAKKDEWDIANWESNQQLKQNLTRAQIIYYRGRNAATIAAAERGETRGAIAGSAKTLGEQASAVEAARSADEKEWGKTGALFAKYYKADGTPDTAAYNRDFPPAPTAKSTQAERDAYNRRIAELGGGTRGKDQLEKLRGEFVSYDQKFKNNQIDGPSTHKRRQQLASKISVGFSQLSGLVKGIPANRPDLISSLSKYETQLQEIQSSLWMDKNEFDAEFNKPPSGVERGNAIDRINSIIANARAEVERAKGGK